MRNAIPSYAELVAPLDALMEHVYAQTGGRSKCRVSKVPIASAWGAEHDAAFAAIKQQLARSTELSHPKQNSSLCLFTDASDTHWAAVLSQVPEEDIKKDVHQQNHKPLSFLSGAFSGSSRSESVPEKEAFPIIEAMSRLDYGGNIYGSRQSSIFVRPIRPDSWHCKAHSVQTHALGC